MRTLFKCGSTQHCKREKAERQAERPPRLAAAAAAGLVCQTEKSVICERRALITMSSERPSYGFTDTAISFTIIIHLIIPPT
jgi:hypothetical protein